MTEANAMVVDRAGGGTNPIAPRKMIILIVSLAFGGIIPICWFIGKDFLNNKVRGRGDMQKAIDAPIMGEIPSKGKRDIEDSIFVVNNGDSSHLSESFRI